MDKGLRFWCPYGRNCWTGREWCGTCSPAPGAALTATAPTGDPTSASATPAPGFLDKIQPGDVVLADRGFTIHDLLAEKGATLEISPFREGRKQFTKEETIRSKLLSRARIHVERFNERIKKYRIISGIVPLSLTPLLSQIVFITCCLVNFKEPLAK